MRDSKKSFLVLVNQCQKAIDENQDKTLTELQDQLYDSAYSSNAVRGPETDGPDEEDPDYEDEEGGDDSSTSITLVSSDDEGREEQEEEEDGDD